MIKSFFKLFVFTFYLFNIFEIKDVKAKNNVILKESFNTINGVYKAKVLNKNKFYWYIAICEYENKINIAFQEIEYQKFNLRFKTDFEFGINSANISSNGTLKIVSKDKKIFYLKVENNKLIGSLFDKKDNLNYSIFGEKVSDELNIRLLEKNLIIFCKDHEFF